MNARFFCTIDKCGRAFQKEEDLKVHLERRHGVKTDTKEEDDDVNDMQIKAKERLFGKKVEKAEKKAEKLTTLMVQEATGEDNLDDITEVSYIQLILRDKGLVEFKSNQDIDLDKLMGLEYLALSHNQIQDIEGVSDMLGLQEVNLNNNLISDITPLEGLAQLRRLFLANNLVKVVLPLKPLKQLTELSLYNNKLFDLEQTLFILRELPKLRILELERNPCVLQTQNSRCRILHVLKLESLDTLQVTDADLQLTFNLFGERENFIPKNLIGRLRANAEANSTIERDLLYQELEDLKEEFQEVKKERDQLLIEKEQASKESVETLKDENLRLRREVSSMYALLDEVNELKTRLKEGLGEYASEIYEENYRLRARVMELEHKQKEVIKRPQTSAGIRPVTAAAKEMNSDEIYEFIERNNRMLINLDNKVSAYKKDLNKFGK